MDINEVIEKYKSYGNVIDEEKVRKAIDFAIKYHAGQFRASGEPYYYHPLQVAELVAEMKLDTDSIVTAILHDTLEDTKLTFAEIEENFGQDVAKLVDGVTKLTKIEFKAENVRQAENFHKLLLAISTDIRVLLVKLADRLHNMRTIDFIANPTKRMKIALETVEVYSPLAEMIGAHQIKEELQDISFRLLHPEARTSILNRFKAICADKDQFIDEIRSEIKKVLAGSVNAEIYGRRKTAYSAWIKMKQKNVSLDKISDIIAFRVVVDSVEDCYKALGIIHTNYLTIPESFQDFISVPKSNGYQSIHTGVVALQQKIEVQIRTKEMHAIAEFGVAAHWKYKQSYKYNFDDKKYSWIRRLLSILEHNNNDPEELLQNTKLAMFHDQVFCFTPKGNLIALPKGATVVDFAYMVHSNIGNYSIGAKINGMIVPLNTQLINGDQIEVVTSDRRTPTVSPTWEKFIVTGKARSEIRKTLRGRKKQQYIELGQNIISKSLEEVGIEYSQEILDKACTFFQKDAESLLFAVGEGNITRKELLQQITPKKSWLIALLTSLIRRGDLEKQKYAVPVKGLIPGMAIHFAKCCHPLRGDRIIGIMHNRNGVTVHIEDCEMLNNFNGLPSQVMHLTWNNDRSIIINTSQLKVMLLNEPGSLLTLINEISQNGYNITNFKIASRSSDRFEVAVDIEISSANLLNRIINNLQTKRVIQQIERH